MITISDLWLCLIQWRRMFEVNERTRSRSPAMRTNNTKTRHFHISMLFSTQITENPSLNCVWVWIYISHLVANHIARKDSHHSRVDRSTETLLLILRKLIPFVCVSILIFFNLVPIDFLISLFFRIFFVFFFFEINFFIFSVSSTGF